MDWIDVNQSVPEDRHRVLTWGESWVLGMKSWRGGHFLGSARFNPRGGMFDIENGGTLCHCRVTHWAEIVGPMPANWNPSPQKQEVAE